MATDRHLDRPTTRIEKDSSRFKDCFVWYGASPDCLIFSYQCIHVTWRAEGKMRFEHFISYRCVHNREHERVESCSLRTHVRSYFVQYTVFAPQQPLPTCTGGKTLQRLRPQRQRGNWFAALVAHGTRYQGLRSAIYEYCCTGSACMRKVSPVQQQHTSHG